MSRYLHTVWCDDIRQEVGNKPSMMGMYTGSIVLPQLPLLLQRLSVFNWINTPVERPFRGAIKVRVKLDNGTELLQMEMPPPQGLEEQSVPDAAGYQLIMGFGIGPINLPAGCAYIVAEAELEGETLIGPKLRVKVDRSYVERTMPQSLADVMSIDTPEAPRS